MTARRLAVALALAALAALAWLLLSASPFAVMLVAGRSMEPTMSADDMVLVRERADYASGDVVAYRVPDGEPGAGVIIIHRIVGGSAAEGFLTRGDNESGLDPWRPRLGDVVGRRVVVVPRVGAAARFVRSGLGLAALAALVTVGLALSTGGPGPWARRRPGAS